MSVDLARLRRTPVSIRCLWTLADGDWHDPAEVAGSVGVTFQTAQTFLGTARWLGVLEVSNETIGQPKYRVRNWPLFEESVAPFRPYLDGSYRVALEAARTEARRKLFAVPTTEDGGAG
jgi:hypothetical protein